MATWLQFLEDLNSFSVLAQMTAQMTKPQNVQGSVQQPEI